MKRFFRGNSYVPPKVGHEGLQILVKQAYALYQSEVITKKKSYYLCMYDFINSIQFHDNYDAWSKNEHHRNYLTVTKLLIEHGKLVKSYFARPSLSDSDINELIDRFYSGKTFLHTNISSSGPVDNASVHQFESDPIDEELIAELIVTVANEIKLFEEQITLSDAFTLLGHEKYRSLKTTNNTSLVLFFDRLSSLNLVSDTWQVDVSRREVVKSSSGKKILTQHDLSSTLYRLNERKPLLKKQIEIIELIDMRYNQLKEDKSIKSND